MKLRIVVPAKDYVSDGKHVIDLGFDSTNAIAG